MPTLKDIATRLGVSPATVSRALNGFPEVREDTRLRVQQMAREMGYQPNQLARKLVTGKSGIVGMVVKARQHGQVDPSFFQVITGISQHLVEFDIDLVFHVSALTDTLSAYKRLVRKHTLDAFILNAPEKDDPRVPFLEEQGVPFVMHGRTSMDSPYPYYDIDNYTAGRAPTDLLLDLGHQHIALLNGPRDATFAQERLRGFREAHQDRGRSPLPSLIHHFPFVTYDSYEVIQRLLSETPRPTAVLCTSTIFAHSVVKVARLLSLKVPRDLSVIAHDDDLPLQASLIDPPLTVTRAPLQNACRPLAEIVHSMLNNPEASDLQRIEPVELIVRQSIAPAPS